LIAGPSASLEKDPVRRSYAEFALYALHSANGRYEEAQVHLENAIQSSPQDVFLLQRMALLLKKRKKLKEALEFAQRCVALEPDNVKHHLLVAEISGLLGEEETAIRAYERALDLDPQHKRARLVLITLLIKKGRYTEALAQLDKVTEQDPSLVIAHYYRGRVFLEMEKPSQSEEAYQEALRLNERMEPALFDLGSLYQMQGRFEKAVEIYERLIDYYPVNMTVRERLIELYYKLGREADAEKQMDAIKRQSKPGERIRQSLGLIYLRHGRLEESIHELEMIVKAWPNDDKSRYYLASAHEERGDLDAALESFREIGQDSEYFANAQMHIAYILDTQDRPAEAEAVLREAIRIDGEKSELSLMLASILEGREAYAEALEVIEKALSSDPKNAELVFKLGVILDKRGQKEASLTQMQRVLEIEPEHADAMNYIGYTYAEQGVRLDEALELIERALRIKPESGYIIDSLGWVYYQKGAYEDALQHIQRASELQPEDPTITEHLGDAFLKNGKYEEALKAYQRALELDHAKPEAIQEKIDEVEALIGKTKGTE